jgi:hypothetical protein
VAKRQTEANANVTLLAAATIVVAFMGNAAAESPHDRQAPSGGLNFKEDCSAAPNGTGVPDKSANLSDQLSQSNGVICPPSGVDPKMAAPPPEGGAMTVIPPARHARRRSEHRPEMR